MAVDMFLKLNGVTGESKDKVHTNEIDVLSWSWGMTNNGSAHVGGGAGSGKVSVQDLTLSKFVDSSSPKLMLGCCNGKHFPDALLTAERGRLGDATLPPLRVAKSPELHPLFLQHILQSPCRRVEAAHPVHARARRSRR